MFRSQTIVFLALFPLLLFAQSGADYLPARIGSTWRYQRTTLDSLQRPIAATKRVETDSLAGTKLFGALQAFVFRNQTNAERDSSIVSAHGDTVAFFNGGYPKEGVKLVSDSLGLGFLPQASGWYSYMKLKSPPVDNRADTLYRHDSTITVDGAEFDLSLLIMRTRRTAGSLTVPAGTFNMVTPFEVTLTLNWWMWGPWGRRATPFLKLTTTYYVAPGNWIVKETQNSTYFPLTATDNDSIPSFTIPGYERLLEKMTPTSVNGGDEGANAAPVPEALTLRQNYPNPFNGSTTIRFELTQRTRVALAIYDVLGRCVWTRAAEDMSPGQRTLSWDSGTLPSGVYLCRITAGALSRTQKMLLQK